MSGMMGKTDPQILGEILESSVAEAAYDQLSELIATQASKEAIDRAESQLREEIVGYFEEKRGGAPSLLVDKFMRLAISDIRMDLLNEHVTKPPGKGR